MPLAKDICSSCGRGKQIHQEIIVSNCVGKIYRKLHKDYSLSKTARFTHD